MVATILTLKWRTMAHLLRRERWRSLVLVGGVVWAASLIPALIWMRFNLSFSPISDRNAALVLVTAALAVGWLVVPVLITGLDDTLSPSRFASLGVSARRLMPGLTVAQFLTIPVAVTTMVLVILATNYRARWFGYAPTLWGLVGALLSVAVMVLAARVAVLWVTRLLSSTRGRVMAVWGVGGALTVVTMLAIVAIRDGVEDAFYFTVLPLVEGLGRTPLGAGGALPNLAVFEEWSAIGWRVAMLVAVITVLHLAWRQSVEHALVNPAFHRGGGRRRRDTVLQSAERRKGSRIPQPTRVIAQRLRRYWLGDPRYGASLAGVVALPVMFLAIAMPVLELEARWAYLVPLLLASTMGWGRHNDVALDSTALWMDITAGTLGRHIMRGRMAVVAVGALPVVAAVVVVVAFASGIWSLALPVFATCVGIIGVTLGVSAITSVVFPYRAPAPGENPFSAEVGSVAAAFIAQVIASALAAVAIPLVVAPLAFTVWWDDAWAPVAVAVGLVMGPVVWWFATSVAGTLFDQRSGRLVQAVA